MIVGRTRGDIQRRAIQGADAWVTKSAARPSMSNVATLKANNGVPYWISFLSKDQ